MPGESSAGRSDQVEVTKDELLALVDEHPLEEGYMRVMKPMILPLSIEEVWESFYADDAKYFLDNLIEAMGDQALNKTDWHSVEEDVYKEAFGHDVN